MDGLYRSHYKSLRLLLKNELDRAQISTTPMRRNRGPRVYEESIVFGVILWIYISSSFFEISMNV